MKIDSSIPGTISIKNLHHKNIYGKHNKKIFNLRINKVLTNMFWDDELQFAIYRIMYNIGYG